MKPWRRPWFVVPVSVGLVLGLGRGALAAFSATTTDGVNQFVAATDWEPPHVTRTIIAKTPGYLGGKIRQGGQFFVYAQIDDGGNPPAGVGTVTADVSAFSTGGTAVAMTAGAFSVEGVLYNYRSAARTAINPMANGTRTYSFTMADVAVPVHSQTQTGFTVTIDNTGPAPVNMTRANRAGGDDRARGAGRQRHVHVERTHRPGVAHARMERRFARHGDGADPERAAPTTGSASAAPRAATCNFGTRSAAAELRHTAPATSRARRSRCSATPSRSCSGRRAAR